MSDPLSFSTEISQETGRTREIDGFVEGPTSRLHKLQQT